MSPGNIWKSQLHVFEKTTQHTCSSKSHAIIVAASVCALFPILFQHAFHVVRRLHANEFGKGATEEVWAYI